MKVFFADPGLAGPIIFTTRCQECGEYYQELAERMLQILTSQADRFLCIQCDPDAEHERICLSVPIDAGGSEREA